jgi:hypothetical protein
MVLFILKFSACLAIFMLFYKLFLEKESFHQFKRFYLISVLILAVSIPLITFTTYIEIPAIQTTTSNSEFVTPPFVPEHMFEETVTYWPTILWTIYTMGVLIFGFRFGLNLFKIVKRIRQNPKFKNQSVIHVLLNDFVQPHTFLNYIFFNKTKYEANKIPKEVLLHEETHAKEKHALDILFIEILQVVFWFNPLLYFIKKDIKLNHEFLADQAVIQNGIELKKYQNILLAFSSDVKEPQLANAINYSSIKKRFTVMKTHTSKTRIWIRSLVLLPLLAILIYSFSSNKTVEKYIASEASDINHTARSIDIEVFENDTYEIDGHKATKETFVTVINKLHQDITPEIRNRIINVHVNDGKTVSDKDVWFIYNAVIDYGFHRIVTYNQEIIRAKGNKPFAITSKTKNQKGASKEQIAEYNKLAKYCSNEIKNHGIIKHKNVERLKYLYDLMSDEQRKSAEPLPDFSKLPPPPPPANSSNEEKLKYEKARLNYEKARLSQEVKKQESYKQKQTVVEERQLALSQRQAILKEREALLQIEKNKIKESGNPPPPPPPIPANATPEQKEKYRKISEEYYKKYKVEHGKITRKVPPPPPPPKSALDHVIAMAKKDAIFYYEGKKISSDKAISILKKDSELSISTNDSNSKNPIVHITTNPVITDNNGKVITKVDSLSEVEKNVNEDKVGYVRINGKVYYYSIKNSKISYYNRWGELVNKKGIPLKPN